MQSSHNLVVLGGGVAGLEIATSLARRNRGKPRFNVTLVDREPAHVWKPMLHTIAAGTVDVHQQQTSLVAQARQCGLSFQFGEITAIDRAARRVSLAPVSDVNGQEILAGRDIDYDTLIVAVGSLANDFGTPGAAEHCWTIDSRGQAMAFNDEVRRRILLAAARDTSLTIGIVGGGATGVELAAELIQLAELAEFYGARGMADRVKVILVEGADRLLTAFPERISVLARQRLEELGVAVRTSARVTEVSANGLHLKEAGLIETDLTVWAAGVKAPDLLATAGELESNRSNQLVVTPNLRTTRDEAIFAVGDCASLTLPGQDRALPPTAQVAHQQARYLYRYLPRLVDGQPAPDFRFRDAGSLVSLGGYGAYGSLGKIGIYKGGFIQGRIAQLGHILLYRSHQGRLHGFWRGSLIWLVDLLNARVRPKIRLD